MNYYFDPESSPVSTFVSTTPRNTRPCPFKGHYTLTGSNPALLSLLASSADRERFKNCRSVSVEMRAGCSDSSDLQVETKCHSVPEDSKILSWSNRNEVMNDEPYSKSQQVQVVKNKFTCHGRWTEQVLESTHDKRNEQVLSNDYFKANSLLLRSPPEQSKRHLLMLSTGPNLLSEDDNSFQRRFVCLSYTEKDGILLAAASQESCELAKESYSSNVFNITSSGPCLQALTGGVGGIPRPNSLLSLLVVLTLLVSTVIIKIPN